MNPSPVEAIVGSWDLGSGTWVCPGLYGESSRPILMNVCSMNLSPVLSASRLQLPEPVPVFSI